MVGQKLGSYEVIAKLGEGGMGEVYRARDPHLNRDVAIKVLPESFASDPDRVARFTREAQALAALNVSLHRHGARRRTGLGRLDHAGGSPDEGTGVGGAAGGRHPLEAGGRSKVFAPFPDGQKFVASVVPDADRLLLTLVTDFRTPVAASSANSR